MSKLMKAGGVAVSKVKFGKLSEVGKEVRDAFFKYKKSGASAKKPKSALQKRMESGGA